MNGVEFNSKEIFSVLCLVNEEGKECQQWIRHAIVYRTLCLWDDVDAECIGCSCMCVRWSSSRPYRVNIKIQEDRRHLEKVEGER